MSATSQTFSAAIELTEVPAGYFDVAFTATTQPCPWEKAYGGDLIAQAAAAAMRTVPDGPDGKRLNSMHSYFMRPVDIGVEVRYEVEVLRNGRGFSTRQVRGFQHGKPVYVAMASFAAGERGGSFLLDFPHEVPDPEGLPSAAEYLAGRSGGTMTAESKVYWSEGRSFDMRHTPGPVYLSVEGERAPHQAIWIKPFDDLRPAVGLSAEQRDLAALSYVCDYTILEPMLRFLGMPWASEGLTTASLDHSMWFHGPPQPGAINGWLLYAQNAVAVHAGGGLGVGYFFTRSGELLATVAQEGLLRTPRG